MCTRCRSLQIDPTALIKNTDCASVSSALPSSWHPHRSRVDSRRWRWSAARGRRRRCRRRRRRRRWKRRSDRRAEESTKELQVSWPATATGRRPEFDNDDDDDTHHNYDASDYNFNNSSSEWRRHLRKPGYRTPHRTGTSLLLCQKAFHHLKPLKHYWRLLIVSTWALFQRGSRESLRGCRLEKAKM